MYGDRQNNSKYHHRQGPGVGLKLSQIPVILNQDSVHLEPCTLGIPLLLMIIINSTHDIDRVEHVKY